MRRVAKTNIHNHSKSIIHSEKTSQKPIIYKYHKINMLRLLDDCEREYLDRLGQRNKAAIEFKQSEATLEELLTQLKIQITNE